MSLQSSRTSFSGGRMGHSGMAFRATGLIFKLFSISLTVAFFLLLSLSFVYTSSNDPSNHRLGFSNDLYGVGSKRRSILGLKSDPLKPRLDQIRKQADDHRALALAYASYARKVKLENSKFVRVFAELSGNLSDLVIKPPYSALFESDAKSIDESVLRQFEKDVKERIKALRQVVVEAKESLDNQLKIQKLKDTIFAVNEQVTKARCFF